jgi:hypothetical protein
MSFASKTSKASENAFHYSFLSCVELGIAYIGNAFSSSAFSMHIVLSGFVLS